MIYFIFFLLVGSVVTDQLFQGRSINPFRIFGKRLGQGTGMLFKGVEKPTTTLAKMLIVEFTKNLSKQESTSSYYAYSFFRGTDKGEFEYDTYYSGGVSKARFRVPSQKEWVEFDKDERKLFTDAFEKIDKLIEDKEEADAVAKEQQSAVDAIAAWMGVDAPGKALPPPAVSVDPVLTPTCEFSCCKEKK